MKHLRKSQQLTASCLKQSRLVVVAIVLHSCAAMPAYAQGVLEPIIERLDYRQLQQQMIAAPQGNDAPLTQSAMPLQALPLLESEQESVLAEQAKLEQQPISLEEKIETQIVKSDLQQYGYDLFQSSPTTYAQVEDLPVPVDYMVGPGDNITVQLYGGRNVEYNLVVTRDGKLLLPELGPFEVSGLTFDELKVGIANLYAQKVIGVKAVVSMSQLRTIQVRITGEVEQPGMYTVSGLSTLVDAILSTGGIRYSGSLRSIEVKRRGRLLTRLDLYDLLMKGNTAGDIALSHNDVIYVPPIGDIVYVGGEVQRPAIYELKNERSLQQVINLAGGLLPTASIEASHIERIVKRRYKTLIDLSSKQSGHNTVPNFTVKAGDFVRFLPVADTMDDVVLVSGHSKRPGGYQLQQNATISNLVLNRDQIIANTDLDFALLVREEQGTRRTEVTFVDLTMALTQPKSAQDLSLRRRDELRLFSLRPDRADDLAGLVSKLDMQSTSYQPSQTASILGAARFTGRFPLQKNIQLLDFLKIGGGIKQGVDLDYVVVASTEYPSNKMSMQSYSLDAALRAPSSEANPIVKPGDRVYLFDDNIDRSKLMQADLDKLRSQADYMDNEQIVGANGLFNKPGLYPLEDGMRASDLVCAAGGLAVEAFGLEAELSRYKIIDGDKRQLDHIVLSAKDLAVLCKTKAKNSNSTHLIAQQHQVAKYGQLKEVNGVKTITDIVEPVYFDSGKFQLDVKDIDSLREAMLYYKKKASSVRLTVVGHTDSVPLSKSSQEKYGTNKTLSLYRAKEVAKHIGAALQLNTYDIDIKGMGSEQPVVSNDTAEGRSKNRRTEIQLVINNLPGVSAKYKKLALNDDAGLTASNTANLREDKNPLLKPHDQLTFVQKPNWIKKARVYLSGEVLRPGTYVINRGETLCQVMERAGGVTNDAYIFGANFTRRTVYDMQKKTLDSIQDQLDDILVELSMSHSARNNEKTPAGDSKDEYFQIIEQLDRAEPNGRLVVDLEEVLECDRNARVVLEDGDKLHVPTMPTYVNVAGQVYVPTSHMYRKDRDAEDYIELSGGGTVIGRVKDAYIIQANGEVMSYSGRRSSKRITRTTINPGAEIIVPLNLDRMNTTELVQSWTRSLMETALFAGILL